MTTRRSAAAISDETALTTPSSPKQVQRPPPSFRDMVPHKAKFPLAIATSFALASLGYSLLNELTNGELAALSRTQDTWPEVSLLAGWRIWIAWMWQCWICYLTGLTSVETLLAGWISLKANVSKFYLLTTFYGLSWTTAASALAVDIFSVAVPFYLLRPLSTIHTPSAAAAAGLPNRELLDLPLQSYTAALSTGIYTVVLVLALRFVLPRILVVNYSGVGTLEPAYNASYAAILPVTTLFGIAASTFIFAPFATTARAKEDDKVDEFDPVAASLGETVWWNVWGYTVKTKVVIRRTAMVAFVAAVNTFLASFKTMYRVDAIGAAAYAGVWTFAAICSGIGLGFVGGD